LAQTHREVLGRGQPRLGVHARGRDEARPTGCGPALAQRPHGLDRRRAVLEDAVEVREVVERLADPDPVLRARGPERLDRVEHAHVEGHREDDVVDDGLVPVARAQPHRGEAAHAPRLPDLHEGRLGRGRTRHAGRDGTHRRGRRGRAGQESRGSPRRTRMARLGPEDAQNGQAVRGVTGDAAVLSDAELIAAVRAGDTNAFAPLYERHGAAAQAVARQYTRSQADAEDITSDAFAKVLSVIAAGGGPDEAFRAYLFTVVRRLAFAWAQSGRRVQPTDDVATFESAYGPAGSVEEPALEGFERTVVARAYDALPERWQAVLWYTEVEGRSAAEIAPLLGISANGVAALTYRAREGL